MKRDKVNNEYPNYYNDSYKKLKQKHFLGNIVKIRIAPDIIPEDEIICDEGVILAAFYFHYWHMDIKVHRLEYDVILPKKYWGSIGRKVRINQERIIVNKSL